MIKFKYIIGGNIELDVEANILPAEPEVDYAGGVDIESVKLNGMDVETDDIYIMVKTVLWDRPIPLYALLEDAAMERASEENEE